MVSQNLDQILRAAQALTPEEREELRCLLNERADLQSVVVTEEEKLAAALLKKGITLTIPPKPTDEEMARFNAWKPVAIEGKPLSETIVEERR